MDEWCGFALDAIEKNTDWVAISARCRDRGQFDLFRLALDHAHVEWF